MRARSLTVVGFCAILFAAPDAQATGNVLLPALDGNAPATPNLGIAPPPPSSPSAPPAAATPQPDATALTAGQTPTTSLTPEQQKALTAKTPAPGANYTMNDFITPIDAESAKKLPPGAVPTQIIHQTDDSAAIAEATANLPSTLAISISGQSVFGAKDVADISDKLGLSRDQIAANCYLSVTGLIQTDKGGGIVYGGLSPKITVHYDGTLQGSMISGEALCTAGKLPPGSGLVTLMGNRYIIPLQPINCDAPKRQVTQMIVTYDGTDKSSCTYR